MTEGYTREHFKGYNILLCPSSNLFVQTLTLMTSIMKKCNEKLHFFIMISDWNESLKHSCRKYVKKYSHSEVSFIEVNDEQFHSFTPWRGYYQCYYMFEAPNLLPTEVDRILYLDIDTVVMGNISLLYETDFEGCFFVAAEENCKRKRSDFALSEAKQKQPALFNSGVLLMNISKLRAEGIDISYYLGQIEGMAGKDYFADQGLLNYCFWDKIKLVPSYNWNHTTYQEILFKEMQVCDSDLLALTYNETYSQQQYDIVAVGVIIVHFTVSEKPWDIYVNPSYEIFGKIVPSEIRLYVTQYYTSWWEFARELPLDMYEELLRGAFEKERLRCIRRETELNNALNFSRALSADLLGEKRFIANIETIKEMGLRTAVFKANDIAGKLLLKALREHGVKIVFETFRNGIHKLKAEDIDKCMSADLIIGADVHLRSCPVIPNTKSINIYDFLDSEDAVKKIYENKENNK